MILPSKCAQQSAFSRLTTRVSLRVFRNSKLLFTTPLMAYGSCIMFVHAVNTIGGALAVVVEVCCCPACHPCLLLNNPCLLISTERKFLKSALNSVLPCREVCGPALFFASLSPEEARSPSLRSRKPSASAGPSDSAVVVEGQKITIDLLWLDLASACRSWSVTVHVLYWTQSTMTALGLGCPAQVYPGLLRTIYYLLPVVTLKYPTWCWSCQTSDRT
jgi:hypothetical protein